MKQVKHLALVWPEVTKVVFEDGIGMLWIQLNQSTRRRRLKQIIPDWIQDETKFNLCSHFANEMNISIAKLTVATSGWMFIVLSPSQHPFAVKATLYEALEEIPQQKVKVHPTRFSKVRIAHFSGNLDIYSIFKLKVLFR